VISVSTKLGDSSIIELVTGLIEVSKFELLGDNPRIFCLQALVSVTDFNMNRIGFVWTRIWQRLKEHYSIAGLHHDKFIATFAIDSLK